MPWLVKEAASLLLGFGIEQGAEAMRPPEPEISPTEAAAMVVVTAAVVGAATYFLMRDDEQPSEVVPAIE